MNELLSRNEVLALWDKFHPYIATYAMRFDTKLRELKPVEPQRIRCKDCKNWDTTWTNDFSPNYHYCPMVDGVRKEDWFCADAERKTE
jgi:hypothetical protein